MNTYKSSDGLRYTHTQIDARIRTAKAALLQNQSYEHGYHFCEKCGNNGSNTRLDCSHDISVKRSKETGQTEKCWDVENLKVLCRTCHQEKDGLDLVFFE